MRALVVYESVSGNTRQIAEEVGRGLAACHASVTVRSVHDARPEDLDEIELLVVGAPVRMFTRTSRNLQRWLDRVPEGRGRSAAVFETRVGSPRARKMAQQLGRELVDAGWSLVVPPLSFRAKAVDGPLSWGERGHAQAWATEIASFADEAIERRPSDGPLQRPSSRRRPARLSPATHRAG